MSENDTEPDGVPNDEVTDAVNVIFDPAVPEDGADTVIEVAAGVIVTV